MGNCTLDFCDKPARSRINPYCEGHYYQKRRGREFTTLNKTRHHAPVGDCCVAGCHTEAMSHNNTLCLKHETRMRRHGDPHTVKYNVMSGSANPGWKSDDVCYGTAHQRVYRTRGRASEHKCSCGADAQQWSYTHDCPREKQSDLGPFSPDPSRYRPMCVPCHKKSDLNRRQLTA